jgi:hypothetical protein
MKIRATLAVLVAIAALLFVARLANRYDRGDEGTPCVTFIAPDGTCVAAPDDPGPIVEVPGPLVWKAVKELTPEDRAWLAWHKARTQ